MAPRDSRTPGVARTQSQLPKKQKLSKLPPNAKVTKRPLLRPAIPSPYANASQQKIVYVSPRTPFLSAVKRAEKLLDLSDKRLVQAATTLAKTQGSKKRKRAGDDDDIQEIAHEMERLRGNKRRKVGGEGRGLPTGDGGGEDVEAAAREEVIIKGTGKAVNRVLEMALWFQQREERFNVRLKTGSVGAVDDVEIPVDAERDTGRHQDKDGMAVEGAIADSEQVADDGAGKDSEANRHTVPETRIRYLSMLEVYVSLR